MFSIAVLSEFQKTGVSEKLMQKFIEESERLGKEKILLICKMVENQGQCTVASSGMRCIYSCNNISLTFHFYTFEHNFLRLGIVFVMHDI
ncbi:MAG TPA: hypothetical protein ACFYDZ_09520, partial [Candidatus Brocadiaceae bacterium]